MKLLRITRINRCHIDPSTECSGACLLCACTLDTGLAATGMLVIPDFDREEWERLLRGELAAYPRRVLFSLPTPRELPTRWLPPLTEGDHREIRVDAFRAGFMPTQLKITCACGEKIIAADKSETVALNNVRRGHHIHAGLTDPIERPEFRPATVDPVTPPPGPVVRDYFEYAGREDSRIDRHKRRADIASGSRHLCGDRNAVGGASLVACGLISGHYGPHEALLSW